MTQIEVEIVALRGNNQPSVSLLAIDSCREDGARFAAKSVEIVYYPIKKSGAKVNVGKNGAKETLYENVGHAKADDITDSQGGALEQMVSDAGEKVGESLMQFAESSTKAMERGQSYVRENPKTSLLMALASGVVIGGFATLILSRRK